MAAIDGIQNKLAPGDPLDTDIYSMSSKDGSAIEQTPASLERSLAALQEDHDFLLRDDVFTTDLIETWIQYKLQNEVEAIQLRPHPYEFSLYYDC